MKSTAFCITGWHYPLDFYQAFAGISDVDIYIVSHQKRLDIPDFLIALFSEEQILFRSNIGYDWGCYQQFINSGLWQQYQTLFFLHDDIKIHDFGFVEEAKEMLNTRGDWKRPGQRRSEFHRCPQSPICLRPFQL